MSEEVDDDNCETCDTSLTPSVVPVGVEMGGDVQGDMFVDVSKEDSDQLISLNAELSKILDIKNTLSTPPPSLDLSPLECHALQLEEVEVLKAIFDSDVTNLNADWTCFYVRIKFLSDEIKDDDVIRIWFSLPPHYPSVPPVFEIETNESNSFKFSEADELYDLLMQSAIARLGGHMIYDLITLAQEHMHGLMEKKKTETALNNPAVTTTATGTSLEEQETSSDESEEYRRLEVKDADYYRPRQFLGSIADIVSKLPPGVQITRIENVLRQDLASRFNSCHKKMIEQMWQIERKYPFMYNLKPQLAFHGTLPKSLPSIVQHGLLIPGADNKIKVRSGSSLGLGIYLSPDPTFSLCYTDDSCRLIVCAALLGRIYKDGLISKGSSPSSTRYFSVVSASEKEWVFFNAAQVLPCYVIQVKVTDVVSKEYHPPPLVSLLPQNEEEMTSKEKQNKLLARARKYLPFGYGPGRTVILEAGEIDDDEEDYGDYQLLRYEETGKREGSHGIVEDSQLQQFRY